MVMGHGGDGLGQVGGFGFGAWDWGQLVDLNLNTKTQFRLFDLKWDFLLNFLKNSLAYLVPGGLGPPKKSNFIYPGSNPRQVLGRH